MTELMSASSVEEDIRQVLGEVARLRIPAESLTAQDDLYAAGLSSLATVDVMLAIEDRFEIEFTSEWLNRRTFASISALGAAVAALREDAP